MDENEELIMALYSGMLKREPAEKEFREWVGVLKSGKSPAFVATAFCKCPEYQAKNKIGPVRDSSNLYPPTISPHEDRSYGRRERGVQLYLDLLEASLTGMLVEDAPFDYWSDGKFDPKSRLLGRDWPSLAASMIGGVRMRNLRYACETALFDGIDGDFAETGVWRGGACILMRGILEAYGDETRRVFAADSFAGLPPPDVENFPADAGDEHHTRDQLKVSLAEVEDNFRRYGLLDERVVFLEGWFKDTLASAPIDQLAVLRLDGDMYESTIEALEALYHKVSHGGFVIIDDYFLPACAKAVDDYRERHGITSPILAIDGWGTYWRVDHKPIR